MIGWMYLLVAIATEVAGTVALRESDGFTRLRPSLAVVVGYGLSFWFLALTLRHLELSIAYAVWAGVGTAAIAAIGILFLDEGSDFWKLASLALIVVGVIGLNLAEAG